jgi:hypothetical protein
MNNAARIGGKRRIYEDTDSLVRRFAALWVAAWVGMTVLIQLLTLVAFDSTESLTLAPPACYTSAVKLAGQPLIQELLRYQVAAASRSMLDLWGWLQLGLAAGLFLFLVLFSTAGRFQLGLALALLADALLLGLGLIPQMDNYDRQLALTPASQSLAFLTQRSHLANVAFVVSQSVTLLLCLLLLWSLLGRRRGSRGAEVL